MNASTANLDPVRKTALLVSGLDPAAADALLDRLPSEFAAKVRRLAAEMVRIDPAEQRAVLEEFFRASRIRSSPAADVELDPGLAARLAGDSASGATYSVPARETRPFQFLQDADLARLGPHLEREHPQTVAVVIAHLPPVRAAELLECLSPKLQTAVIRRLADLDAADPETLQEVERYLEQLFHEHVRSDERRAAGHAALAEIRNAAQQAGHAHLAETLSRSLAELPHPGPIRSGRSAPLPDDRPRMAQPTEVADDRSSARDILPFARNGRSESSPQLAANSRPAGGETAASPAATLVQRNSPAISTEQSQPQIAFDDLVQLDGRGLGMVLAAAAPQVALLALAGASPRAVTQWLSRLDSVQAKALRQRMDRIGPTRLSDMEEAQRQLAAIAQDLVAAGKIRFPHSRLMLTA